MPGKFDTPDEGENRDWQGAWAVKCSEDWRRRMGIEPTHDRSRPSTGFEVQGPHQQPNASRAVILMAYMSDVKVNLVDCAYTCAVDE